MPLQSAATPVPGRRTRAELPLALLRIVIGWHFLYEGWTKLLDPGWTSAGYLSSASGPLAGLFHSLGSSETLLPFVDQLNIWGLILLGAALMLGLYARAAAVAGITLLGLYYSAYPPLFGPVTNGVSEGQYLIVNKTLVELFALAVIAAFPAPAFGFDGWRSTRRGSLEEPRPAPDRAQRRDQPLPSYLGPMSRRQLVTALTGVPFLGAFTLAVLKKHGWQSVEEVHLASRAAAADGLSGATLKTFQWSSLRDLQGHLPLGQIGNLRLSRMILGGNLIGGWAHARDLIYVSKLVKAYHHRDKVFETFSIAESCGINTVLTNPLLCGVINDYWRHGGKIQFISDCGGKDLLALIQKSIDNGACACYIQGGVADRLVEEGRFDLIEQSLELIWKNGLPGGIGGHKLSTIQACVDKGFTPDFWMKTLHKTDYWSAKPQPECDNIWCEDPQGTVAYMNNLREPWIAFKILAAGAIHPEHAFQYAFENGADFICVGMYDFQIVEDTNLALNALNACGARRERPWCA
jgi:uncharacterized membrane protein YphA (DoxX/SURF4 family)